MREQVEILKALADESRLKIIQMLSCGELCACDIQENLSLTQPTISHHMKVLQQVDLIKVEKRGKWVFYSINQDLVEELCSFLKQVSQPSDHCPCSRIDCDCDGLRK
ncbi:MAG: ArsR/SmtB family transcription factor [Bacillota bacterium]